MTVVATENLVRAQERAGSVRLGKQIDADVRRRQRRGAKSDISDIVYKARDEGMARCMALIDELEAALPALSDEHLVWLIATLQIQGRGRPYDPRDPWAVLLRRSDVELKFVDETWYDALTARVPSAPRYIINVVTARRRHERARTLAHELAHIELDNFGVGCSTEELRQAYAAGAYRAREHATDVRASELFDWWPPARRRLDQQVTT